MTKPYRRLDEPRVTSKILRIEEVQERTGLPRSTLYALMRRSEFPPAVELTVAARGWPEHEIEEWLSNRPRYSYMPQRQGRHNDTSHYLKQRQEAKSAASSEPKEE